MRVAEQVMMDVDPDRVVDLLGRQPAEWLRPFLVLAWREGTRGAAHGGAAPGSHAQHRVRVGAVTQSLEHTSFPMVWHTGRPDAAFASLRGQITVKPWNRKTIVGIVAVTRGSEFDRSPVSLRSAELVVRSLLGLVRNSLEAGVE